MDNSIREVRPTEEPMFTYSDVNIFIELAVMHFASKLGLLDIEISYNEGIKQFKSGVFEKWVTSGALRPSKINGKYRWFKLTDCLALEAEESRYFLKPVKTKNVK